MDPGSNPGTSTIFRPLALKCKKGNHKTVAFFVCSSQKPLKSSFHVFCSSQTCVGPGIRGLTWFGRVFPAPPPKKLRSIPDTWVTVCTGKKGYTISGITCYPCLRKGIRIPVNPCEKPPQGGFFVYVDLPYSKRKVNIKY
jgi:hypothetical protein